MVSHRQSGVNYSSGKILPEFVQSYTISGTDMTIKELYKLQEIDQEIATCEQTRSTLVEKLKGNTEITSIRSKLALVNKQLEDLQRQQRTIERDIEDVVIKLTKFENDLYSGRTANTKELAGMQQEIENLKSKRRSLEDRELGLMESVEKAETAVSLLETRLQHLETSWTEEQQSLQNALKNSEKTLSALRMVRAAAAESIDADTLAMYTELKKQKGTAVAKVERGICTGCRIQISTNEQQKVRSGSLVRCSSCGRILFME